MLPLLLGAAVAGYLFGRKTQKVGHAEGSRLNVRESKRRAMAMAAYRQGIRRGLNDSLAVNTAVTAYKAKGGSDAAFIARLNSMDPKFLEVGAVIDPERRKQRRQDRKNRRNPPPKPTTRIKVVQARPHPFRDGSRRAQASDEQFDDEQFDDQQQFPQGGAAAPQQAPQQGAEADEGDDGPKIPSKEEAAAMAFVNALDNGKDAPAAREMAKQAYAGMGGTDPVFVKKIEGWTEGDQ